MKKTFKKKKKFNSNPLEQVRVNELASERVNRICLKLGNSARHLFPLIIRAYFVRVHIYIFVSLYF